MVSKAQEAALLLLRQREKKLMENVRNLKVDRILSEMKSMSEFIKEYHLDKKLVTETVKGAYRLLMDSERYAEAAALAKKYRL
jgi:hypothetical protein